MKYRKKPIVIEAVQITSCIKDADWPQWLLAAYGAGVLFHDDKNWKIKTLEGIHTVSSDDYIIRGIKGELYPCKPDIFEQTYEKI